MSAVDQLRSLFQQLQASASFHRKGVKEAAALLNSAVSLGELTAAFQDCIDRVLAAGTKAPFDRFFTFVADCCKQHGNALLNSTLKVNSAVRLVEVNYKWAVPAAGDELGPAAPPLLAPCST